MNYTRKNRGGEKRSRSQEKSQEKSPEKSPEKIPENVTKKRKFTKEERDAIAKENLAKKTLREAEKTARNAEKTLKMAEKAEKQAENAEEKAKIQAKKAEERTKKEADKARMQAIKDLQTKQKEELQNPKIEKIMITIASFDMFLKRIEKKPGQFKDIFNDILDNLDIVNVTSENHVLQDPVNKYPENEVLNGYVPQIIDFIKKGPIFLLVLPKQKGGKTTYHDAMQITISEYNKIKTETDKLLIAPKPFILSLNIQKLAEETIRIPIPKDAVYRENLDFYNKFKTKFIKKESVPIVLNIRLDDYYIFLITLFVFDSYHDFRNGYRGDLKTSQEMKNNVQYYLSNKFVSLITEWQKYYSIQKENFEKGISPDDFVNFCKNENVINEKDGLQLVSSSFEPNLVKLIKFIISERSAESRETAVSIYDASREKLKDNTKRFIANNAFTRGAFNISPKPIADENNYKRELLFYDKFNIDNSCKSLPASLYDGASSGKCGSLKSCIFKGGYEFGKFNLAFTVIGLDEPKLILKSDFIEELDNINVGEEKVDKIYQHISINRHFHGDERTAIYKYQILNNQDPVNEIVIMDNELSGYENLINKIKIENIQTIQKGDFGRIVKSETEVDIVFIVRKALCDFGQYLNGILKSGGYTEAPLIKDNTIDPKDDYPFICLHGDQPAAALNMWLLYTIDNAEVNQYSHTVYASETSTYNTSVFANKFGNILEIPIKRKSQALVGGGKYLNAAIDILNRFFRLSFLFKIPSEYFIVFNNFCSTYFLKGTKNYDNFYKELDVLGSVVLKYSGNIPLTVRPLSVMPLQKYILKIGKTGKTGKSGIRKTGKSGVVRKTGKTGKIENNKLMKYSRREQKLRGITNRPVTSRFTRKNPAITNSQQIISQSV